MISAIADLAPTLSIIINVSDTRLENVVTLAEYAWSSGADGVALMPPSFFHLPQADILEFLLRAADHIRLPICLPNIIPEVMKELYDACEDQDKPRIEKPLCQINEILDPLSVASARLPIPCTSLTASKKCSYPDETHCGPRGEI